MLLEATLRGFRAALVEHNDFASGQSSLDQWGCIALMRGRCGWARKLPTAGGRGDGCTRDRLSSGAAEGGGREHRAWSGREPDQQRPARALA